MRRLNLKGLSVLNTRPLNKEDNLSAEIIKAGGQVLNFPVMEITGPQKPWLKYMPNLDDVNQAVFISRNAVHYTFKELARWPDNVLVSAVGTTTANALAGHGVRVDHLPERADSEHLLKLETFQAVKNQLILIFKGEGGRDLIAETLRARGAQVVELNVYRRILPEIIPALRNRWWQEDTADIILFTSVESLFNLFALLGKEAECWLQSKPCLVLSERIAEKAREFGIKSILVCQPDSMMEALHQFNQGFTDEKK